LSLEECRGERAKSEQWIIGPVVAEWIPALCWNFLVPSTPISKVLKRQPSTVPIVLVPIHPASKGRHRPEVQFSLRPPSLSPSTSCQFGRILHLKTDASGNSHIPSPVNHTCRAKQLHFCSTSPLSAKEILLLQ
jgi:hypothetical protein